jgi:hypothetical protein
MRLMRVQELLSPAALSSNVDAAGKLLATEAETGLAETIFISSQL